MVRFSGRIFMGLVLITLSTRGFTQQSSQSVWKLKGAELRVSADKIIYEGKQSTPLSLETNSITAICYDTVIRGRGPSTWEATKGVAQTREAAVVLAPVVIPVAAGVHASKSTQHFVTLHWTSPEPVEDSVPILTVQAEKGDYEALLNELQQRTGKTWTNIAQRRKDIYARLHSELRSAQEEKHEPYLDIKQESRVGNSLLEPYSYRVVLRGGPSEGNLFLLAGLKKDKRVVAVVHVSIREESNPGPDAHAVYSTPAVTPPQVTEIRLPTRTLTMAASQPYDYDPDCPSLP